MIRPVYNNLWYHIYIIYSKFTYTMHNKERKAIGLSVLTTGNYLEFGQENYIKMS